MAEWMGIVLFVVAVLLVVVVHESGHFFVAKAFHIKVEEFFVGFGPRLWSIRRGETEYGVKALPFGGYVRIAGMNPFQEPTAEEYPRTFQSKPIWQRACVIIAGPITHFALALFMLAVFHATIGAPTPRKPVLAGVEATLNGRPSPAAEAGLRPDDEVIAIDGAPVGDTDRFVAYTRAHVGTPIQVTVRRDGREVTVTVTPVLSTVEGESEPVGRLGVTLGEGRERVGPLTAVGRAAIETGQTAKAVVVHLGDAFGPSAIKRIGQLLAGTTERTVNDPSSIIGASRLAGEAVQAGAWDFFVGLLVIFNVFVGILNLVPLPPLDGGHLAILAYEKIRRRRPDPRKLIPVTTTVAGFIILYALAVSYLDIVKPIPSPFQ